MLGFLVNTVKGCSLRKQLEDIISGSICTKQHGERWKYVGVTMV